MVPGGCREEKTKKPESSLVFLTSSQVQTNDKSTFWSRIKVLIPNWLTQSLSPVLIIRADPYLSPEGSNPGGPHILYPLYLQAIRSSLRHGGWDQITTNGA